MEFETLKAMNESLYPSMMMVMLKAIALITGFFAIAGIAISLASIAWLCRQEMRRSKTAPRMARRAAPPNMWESAPRTLNPPVRTAFTHSDHTALPPLQFTAVTREKQRRLAR